MNTIFKFLHSIMVTLTLQISKLPKDVVLNSLPHGRFGSLYTKKMLGVLDYNHGRSSIKIAHFIPIRWQTWSPQTILVSDWPISNNLLLWNCLAKWAELWWEAPIEGYVWIKFPQSRMKGERHRLIPLSLYFQWAKHEHLSYYNL
jgi:hypothetical protein